jgi:hypothetical protein
MYEFKIAKLFSKLAKNYFDVFSSCNNNFKIHKVEKKQDDISNEKYENKIETTFTKVIL